MYLGQILSCLWGTRQNRLFCAAAACVHSYSAEESQGCSAALNPEFPPIFKVVFKYVLTLYSNNNNTYMLIHSVCSHTSRNRKPVSCHAIQPTVLTAEPSGPPTGTVDSTIVKWDTARNHTWAIAQAAASPSESDGDLHVTYVSV